MAAPLTVSLLVLLIGMRAPGFCPVSCYTVVSPSYTALQTVSNTPVLKKKRKKIPPGCYFCNLPHLFAPLLFAAFATSAICQHP